MVCQKKVITITGKFGTPEETDINHWRDCSSRRNWSKLLESLVCQNKVITTTGEFGPPEESDLTNWRAWIARTK